VQQIQTKYGIKTIAVFIALVIVYLILGYAAIVNIVDKPDFFNPAPPVASQFISLDYPPAQGFTVTNDLLHININLTTSGSFVQGQFVNIAVSGGISDRLLYNLSSVSRYLEDKASWEQGGSPYPLPFPNYTGIFVGFAGASNVMNGAVSYPVGGPSVGFVQLYVNYTNPDCIQTLGLGPTYVGSPTQTIVWTSQGDYVPAISFSVGIYGNSNYSDTEQTYSNFIVRVSSSDVLAQARYNRVNEVLAIVLTVFGFVEAFKIIVDSLTGEKSKVIVHTVDDKKAKPGNPKGPTKRAQSNVER